jgi:uncharacterized protein (DUF305 family)
MKMSHYHRLLVMTAMSFVAMFVLTYAMVDVASNALVNLNQVYMAGLMTMSMVLIELLLMRGMYENAKLNAAIAGASTAGLVLFFVLIRQQAAITDEQFLRSMIPHHASAILMCEQAPVSDPEVAALCENIIESQQAEIVQMRAKLRALDE